MPLLNLAPVLPSFNPLLPLPPLWLIIVSLVAILIVCLLLWIALVAAPAESLQPPLFYMVLLAPLILRIAGGLKTLTYVMPPASLSEPLEKIIHLLHLALIGGIP